MSYQPPRSQYNNSANAPFLHDSAGSSSSSHSSESSENLFVNSSGGRSEAEVQELEFKAEQAQRDGSPGAKRGRLIIAIRAAMGEMFATFVLMYVACLATNPLGVAFVAMALIYSFSSISGAHMNPAVTFALWCQKRTSTRKLLFFLIAQLLGGNLAMFAIFLSGNANDTVFDGFALPLPETSTSPGSIFISEVILTFVLVFVIFKVAFEDIETEKKSTMTYRGIASSKGLTIYAANSQSKLGFAPIAIGFCIGTLGLAGPPAGAAYNPVRVLAPAFWSGRFEYSYLYLLGELIGSGLAVSVCWLFDWLARKAAAASSSGNSLSA